MIHVCHHGDYDIVQHWAGRRSGWTGVDLGSHFNLLGVVWALLSIYRPLDDAYRYDVEQYIDNAHTGTFDGRMLNTVQEITKQC